MESNVSYTLMLVTLNVGYINVHNVCIIEYLVVIVSWISLESGATEKNLMVDNLMN